MTKAGREGIEYADRKRDQGRRRSPPFRKIFFIRTIPCKKKENSRGLQRIGFNGVPDYYHGDGKIPQEMNPKGR